MRAELPDDDDSSASREPSRPEPPEPLPFGKASDALYVREPGKTASHVPITAMGEGGLVTVRAATEVSLRASGPFEPLASAVVSDVTVRSRLASALDVPSVRAYAKLRPVLFVGLVPLLMLVELDREMSAAGHHGAKIRLVLGGAFAVMLAVDFARKVPRHPGTSAAVLFWVAARYAHVLAVTCGTAGKVGIFAPILAGAVAIGLLVYAPRGNRLHEEVFDRLGIDPSDAIRERLGTNPSPVLVFASVAAAVGLPLLLALARTQGAGVWTTGALVVLYGLLAPELVERLFERERPRTFRMRPLRVLFAVAVGFALTNGLVSGAQRTFDAGLYLQRCTHPAAFETEGKKLLEAENREVEQGVAKAKDRLAVMLMTVVLVPLAEERLYRGLLQRVLTRRHGERLGLVYASVVFGAAHLVVYRVAAYQAALLGLGFGAAFAEGGLVASVLAHAVWNGHLLF